MRRLTRQQGPAPAQTSSVGNETYSDVLHHEEYELFSGYELRSTLQSTEILISHCYRYTHHMVTSRKRRRLFSVMGNPRTELKRIKNIKTKDNLEYYNWLST